MGDSRAFGTDLPLILIGTRVKPYGKVAAVGIIDGERYYWLVDTQQCVAMIPATALQAHIEAATTATAANSRD